MRGITPEKEKAKGRLRFFSAFGKDHSGGQSLHWFTVNQLINCAGLLFY